MENSLYQLKEDLKEEKVIPEKTTVEWSKELDAYYNKDLGILFSKKEVEESDMWISI